MAVSLEHERALWDAGACIIAGIDEVGRGALAGPVTVGLCAVSRCSTWPEGLADSKRLSAPRRTRMVAALAEHRENDHSPAGFGLARVVAHSSAEEIDDLGIVGALRLAGMRGLAQLQAMDVDVDAVLLDGKHDWLTLPEPDLFASVEPETTAASALYPKVAVPPVTMVIKGDDLCASIAAASIGAKVERDSIMTQAHGQHPEYGWSGNKGYGAAGHLDALRRLGATPWHRRSWNLPAHTPGMAS
ncbi:ribonuclease HII [Demequina sediminicola]|uniref:ribonuclease HII n=1 Tax=Demequina sediminicola TaxID=1095026 RepID=UPI00078454C7|nr:ribonuclease HII [Demequina sediminicola]